LLVTKDSAAAKPSVAAAGKAMTQPTINKTSAADTKNTVRCTSKPAKRMLFSPTR
jgi:hypothetical protein